MKLVWDNPSKATAGKRDAYVLSILTDLCQKSSAALEILSNPSFSPKMLMTGTLTWKRVLPLVAFMALDPLLRALPMRINPLTWTVLLYRYR